MDGLAVAVQLERKSHLPMPAALARPERLQIPSGGCYVYVHGEQPLIAALSTQHNTMASVQRFAASSLRAATRPALSRRTPTLVRYETPGHNPAMKDRPSSSPTESPKERPGPSAMISQENASEAQPDHSPDYGVAVDYRTS